jgi:hypothetical protein
MPRFFLHLKRGAQLIRDHEGSELKNAEAAHTEAIQAAREICADAVKEGRQVMADALIIVDEAGGQVRFLPMTEILPKGSTESQAPTGSKHCELAADLSERFDKVCVAVCRLDRVRAEIDRQVDSCHRTIGNIRKQLSAFPLLNAGK